MNELKASHGGKSKNYVKNITQTNFDKIPVTPFKLKKIYIYVSNHFLNGN